MAINIPLVLVPAAAATGSGLILDLPAKAQQMLETTVEKEAVGHWLLGADNPTHADLVARQSLRRFKIVSINNGGAGYTSAPNVAFTAPGMTGIAVLNGGAVSAVFITNHGDDDTVGTVSFAGGGGAGAAGTVYIAGAPTLAAGSLALASSIGALPNGLLSPIALTTNQTIAAVFRRPGADNRSVFGRWSNRPIGPASDHGMLFGRIGATYQASSHITANPYYSIQAVAPPGNSGDWVFGAVTHTPDKRTVFWGGGNTYSAAVALTLPEPASQRGIVVGAADVTYSGGIEIAELIVINRAVGAAELGMIYNRSKKRMAARGIVTV
ncbi:hypothetical protein [uncultured Sphingomonas sp.]|uniref:hypothetical protein n=1 Tax=uncultured Sphingomonas sp. TaxID=158754 RepID=UPI0025F4C01A|nr:hypothetical protein [uncultured Sphingomonas sp.]